MNSTAPSQQFAARKAGATAGVTRQGGQAVFKSSTAPKAANKAAAAANATAPATATRSATGDLWSGVRSASSSPIAAAEASSAGQAGGVGSGVVAGMVILGLGLTGLAGGFVVAGRRRRASAGSIRSTDK